MGHKNDGGGGCDNLFLILAEKLGWVCIFEITSVESASI